jgi:tRNA 2-thiouridine synthesizing protein A
MMLTEESLKPDATLDRTGLYCPQPIIRTAVRVKEIQPAQILEVWATDSGFQIDLPAWCLNHRHKCLGMRQENGVYLGYVRLKGENRQ